MTKWKCPNCEFTTESVEELREHTALHAIRVNKTNDIKEK